MPGQRATPPTFIALRNSTPPDYVRQPTNNVRGQMYPGVGVGDWLFEVEETSGVALVAPGAYRNPGGACADMRRIMTGVEARQRRMVEIAQAAARAKTGGGSVSGLERFIEAQDEGAVFDSALAELRTGRKHGHWIWFVFPQLAGLGLSRMSQIYGIRDRGEATGYLRHPVLFPRLQAVTSAVADHAARGVRLDVLMGSAVDAQKLVSSLTLFARVARGLAAEAPGGAYDTFAAQAERILEAASSQGYPPCGHTLAHLGQSQ